MIQASGSMIMPVVSGAEASPVELFPIRVALLRLDAVPAFDLYLVSRDERRAVLYRGKHIPFTERARRRLLDRGIQRLYVEREQEREYRQYVEQNLSALLADPAVDAHVKSETLYYSATKLMDDVMAEPRSGDLLPRSRNFVENTCGFLREMGALRYLMQVSSHDYYTYTHSVNVMVFSVALAQRAGLSDPTKLSQFGQGTLLHDLGKSLLDPALVNFQGKFDATQWSQMKQHPEHGWSILREHGVTDPAALHVVRHHHEKLRGNGYPDGLNGDSIPMLTRISTIADIFDALTTRRSYKPALDSFSALKLMQDEMSDDLDPDLFRLFVEMLGHPG